jgi:hypothetical protein
MAKKGLEPWNKGRRANYDMDYREGQVYKNRSLNQFGEKKEGSSIQFTPTLWKMLDDLEKSESKLRRKKVSRSEVTEEILRAVPELVEAVENFIVTWAKSLKNTKY